MSGAAIARLLQPLQAAWRQLQRRRLLRLALLLWLAWLVLSALLIPWWLRNQLPDLLQPHGMQLRIEQARFNPFTLAVTTRGIDLRLSDNTPLLTLQELRVNLALTLLRRAAIGFDEIALVQPEISLQLRADGSSNWQQLIAGFANSESEPAGAATETELPRLLLQHFELAAGALQLDDYRYLASGHRSRIDGLGITLNDISTLRDEQGQYQVRGSLPGTGEFAWRGNVALNPLSSSGELALENVALTPLAPLLLPNPGSLQGTLVWSVKYNFRQQPNATSFQLYDGTLSVRDFLWQLAGDAAPRIAWPVLTIDGITLDTDTQQIGLKAFRWENPEFVVARDEFGTLRGLPFADSSITVESAPAPNPSLNPNPPSKAWTLTLAALQVEQLAAQIRDDSRQLPLAIRVDGVNLATALTVNLADAAATLTGLQLSVAELSVAERPLGSAASAATSEPASEPALASTSTAVTESPPFVQLNEFQIADASVAPSLQQFSAARVHLGGGQLAVRRNADGSLWPLSQLPARHPDPAPAPAWQYQIQQLDVAALVVKIVDESVKPRAQVDLTLTRAGLGPLAEPATRDSQLTLQLAMAPQASLTVDGTLSADKNALTATVELNRLPLALANPYLLSKMRAEITNGSLSSHGTLQLRQLSQTPKANYRGWASIDRFDLQANQQSLLAWQQLKANGLRFDSQPVALSIDQLIWQKPVATLHFAADGSNNFTALQPAAADAPAVNTATPVTNTSSQSSTPATSPVQMRLKRLDLIDGSLDFADARLVLPYRANIQRFNGSVIGLSSAPDSRATVALDGQVDSYGQAQLEGELQPLAPTAWLDLILRFRNVALSPLTPYSATFAGREITDGVLTMDLRYRIENGQLKGDNRVVLDRFTLGDPVDSPDAWSLPLDLAIAILKDSDGRIDLAMPVEGDVNNPEFRYGRVIWQALVNVLTKIVTAPFRALASLFGSDAEELEAIAFEPGRSELTPPEREKLDRLASMVGQRPDLQLTVFGQYDEKLDRPALQALALRREVSIRLGQTTSADSQPAPIGLSDVDSQIALEALYDERFGAEARERLLQQKNAGRDKPYKTANRLLSAFGGGSGDVDWYRELQLALEAQQALPADALSQLANARAAAVEPLMAGKLAATQWQRLPAQAATEAEDATVLMGFGLAPLPQAAASPAAAPH